MSCRALRKVRERGWRLLRPEAMAGRHYPAARGHSRFPVDQATVDPPAAGAVAGGSAWAADWVVVAESAESAGAADAAAAVGASNSFAALTTAGPRNIGPNNPRD